MEIIEVLDKMPKNSTIVNNVIKCVDKYPKIYEKIKNVVEDKKGKES